MYTFRLEREREKERERERERERGPEVYSCTSLLARVSPREVRKGNDSIFASLSLLQHFVSAGAWDEEANTYIHTYITYICITLHYITLHYIGT